MLFCAFYRQITETFIILTIYLRATEKTHMYRRKINYTTFKTLINMCYHTIGKNFVTLVYVPFSVSHPRMTWDYSPRLSAMLGSSPTLYSAASYSTICQSLGFTLGLQLSQNIPSNSLLFIMGRARISLHIILWCKLRVRIM